MKIIRFFLFAFILFCMSQFLFGAASADVQMLPDSGEMQPGTTLEFRFANAMVASDALGMTKDAPVVFEPELPGTFTWLSTRSGVFVPQGPLPLGERWTVRLRSGLQDAKGGAIPAGWSAVVQTPPFGVTTVANGVWDKDHVSAQVSVKLAFRLPVMANAEFFRFVDDAGREVAAEVRHAVKGDYFNVGGADEDWKTRWKLLRDPSARAEQESFPARVIVTPRTPLPAGKGWKLLVKAGLAAESGREKLAEPYEIPLGTVQPFALKTLEAANFINSGPTLTMIFSGALAPDITGQDIGKFFTISPEPSELTWEVDYDTVVVRGKFERDRDYKLTISEAVCSEVGQPFTGVRAQTVRFGPVLPRLYLPELTMSQILSGRRILPVRSVNLAALHVKATLLAPDSAVRALSVFKKDEWKYDNGEAIALKGIQGRILCDETITPSDVTLDAPQTTELDWTTLFGGKKAGVILLELRGTALPDVPSQTPAAQAFLQLTDLGVLWQKTGDTIRTRIFSMETVAPVAGASVRLLDAKFQSAATGKTEAQGEVSLTYKKEPEWLVVSSGNDTCVVRMGANADALRIGDWYSANWSPGRGDEILRAMMFTDRPLYQPAETVHLKGFLRLIEGGDFAVAEKQEAVLVLRDPQFDEVLRQDVTTDAQGTFDAELVLPRSPLGNYLLQLEVEDAGVVTSVPLLLAAYQPNAFKVTVDISEKFPAGSPAPQATIGGQYFFGGDLTSADVRWTLQYRQETFTPSGFDSFTFLGDEEEGAKPLTLRGEVHLADSQSVSIQPMLPTPEGAPFRGVLSAEVTDINQQTVTGQATFTRQASDFYLGIAHDEERVIPLGNELPLQIIAVQPDGQPLSAPVETTVEIEHWRYHVVRTLGAGGAVTFRDDLIKEPVATMKAMTIIPERRGEGWTAGSQESTRFKPTTIGRHQVRVTARDAAGRKVTTETSFYVSGAGETAWDYRNPWEIKLVPDKESYLPGETARVLVQTPMDGLGFVSIERGDAILRSTQEKLKGNAPVLEIPIVENDPPNINVSLVILRGADQSPRQFPAPDFRFGSCTLHVAAPEAHLHVDVSPAQSKIQPGDEVIATIRVRNHEGKPVMGAGVTFYAVDDGVLALTDFKRPDPADIFLASVPTRVLTGLNLAQLLPEDPNDIRFGNKGYLIGGGGDGGLTTLRENFPGTACWQSGLTTKEDGCVTVRFKAPDALTRYRLIAVAASGTMAFGSGESGVKITRPLMILPAMGQFANVGDKLVARAVIRNDTGSDGTVDVVLKTPAGENHASLTIPNASAQAVDFPITFSNEGAAALEWSATLRAGDTSFTDSVKIALPIGSPMLQLRETYFTQIGEKANNLLTGINPQLVEGRGSVDVTVANTRLVGLGERVRFLVEYPYGCVEQTTSALVPWLVMPTLGPLIPRFAREENETQRVITETLAKLLEFQTEDGGLAFWKGGTQSVPFPSAWTAIVLSRAAARGVTMPAGWNALLEYLTKSLRGLDGTTHDQQLAEKAYAAYALALAGRAEASYHEELFRRRANLSPDARAILALAILQSHGSRDMVAELLKPDATAPENTSAFGDAARDCAIRLLAWTHYEPANHEVAILLAELLTFESGTRNSTTQNAAWALLALTDYREKIEKPAQQTRKVHGTLTSGTDAIPFTVSTKSPAFAKTFSWAPQNGAPTLSVENSSTTPLYAETQFAIYPPLGEQPRQDRGFAVSRSYQKIASDGSLQPAENLRVGDRLVVTLRVETTRSAAFMVLEDPLPSILEAVNPEFVSRHVAGVEAESPWLISHREMRADRVLYFCDALPPGAYTFTYLARVRMAGEALAAAPTVTSMYRPERFGLGEISRLRSQAVD